jgi:peptide chain release factor subunit 1
MTDVDRALLRKLAEWTPGDLPIVSLHLSVDGRRYPRKQDYEVRLDALLRRGREAAEGMGREARRSRETDLDRMERFVKDEFERGANRGLALFGCAGAGLWEEIVLPRPLLSRIEIGPQPDLLPLEAMLETYESFCTILIDSERARIFVAELGRIEEKADLSDDVPGRHDQGGWSQARYQRHIDEHRQRHLRRVADVLFRSFKRRQFDHLILAGPEEVISEFEHELHDYLRQRVRARFQMPITALAAEVLERSLQTQEQIEREQERAIVRELVAEQAAGRKAVAGLHSTLRALGEARVARLVVTLDLRAEGLGCLTCGRLTTRGKRCEACGSPLHPVPDVVEAAVVQAYRQGCGVQIVPEDDLLKELGGVGALLRF